MTVFRCSNNIGVGVATCKVCFGSINVFMPGTNITFERSIYNLPDVLVWMAYIYLCSLILFALAEGFPVDRGMYLVAFSFFFKSPFFIHAMYCWPRDHKKPIWPIVPWSSQIRRSLYPYRLRTYKLLSTAESCRGPWFCVQNWRAVISLFVFVST